MSLSPTTKDCVTAVTKAVKKRLSGDVVERQDAAGVVELQLQVSLPSLPEAATTLLAAMTKAACGADKGSTKLPKGDIIVDTAAALPVRSFSEAVRVASFRFQDLPSDNPTLCAVAEATYSRHLQRTSQLSVYGLQDFPPCLLRDALSRFDVSVGGYVVLSLAVAQDKRVVLRLFPAAVDAVMSNMCSTAFTAGVLPASWVRRSSLEPHQLLDALEDVQIAVNEYWHDSAQDDHARSVAVFLMSSVGSDICDFFKAKLSASDGVFRGDKKVVEEAHLCCDEWVSICGKLTTIDWASEWEERYEDAALLCVRDRLRTALALRGLVEEVGELLGPDDFRALKTELLWDVFADVAVMDSAASVQSQWNAALAAYYRRLEPIEHRCATVLRHLFASRAGLAPQAILNEFSGYCHLMRRPIIARELVAERDGLLGKLNDRLGAIRLEYERRAESTEDERVLEEEDRRCQTGRFFPGVVNNIVWLRQLRGRIEEMVAMCSSILNDLPNASAFVASARQLLDEVQDYEQECFRGWASDVEDKSDALTLDADAPLMEIDAKGRVEVNFAERLVQLLKEVRVLGTLGFAIPRQVTRIAQQGAQFLPMGVALKQVAHTYNSMAADIIPCTRAMLLEPALGFEKVITADGSQRLTWRSTKEASRFIETLQGASQSLTECNRRLHKTHQELEGLVGELFRISLLRSRDRWVRKVRQMREKIEQAGFQNTAAWREFWDMQLYKVMEAQYQLGLESLHESVDEIKADIVWDATTGQAALRPSMEALRAQYYQRIHDFITFPQRFQGCGDKSVFMDMPSRNANGVYAVLQHASQLFKRVAQELKRFSPYLVIGRCGTGDNPTLEQIVSRSLTEVQHWEQSVRLLKQKGKEINSEDLFIRCDCITLCTAAIKGAVEEHLVQLTEALKSTLKQSAEQHLASINDYLAKAAACLDSKLTKLDEIGAANLLYGELMEQRPAMEVEFYHFYNKNVLLQNMTGTAGLDFTKTKERWDSFMKRLDSHEKEVENQLNQMKGTVSESLKEWEKDSIRFTTRWHEMKPKDLNSQKPLEFVTKRKQELQVLKERGAECRKQCEYFHLEEPDLQPLEEAEADIEDYFNMWSMLGDFQEQVQELCKEAWISFRAKLYRFDDFVKLWQEKLKEIPANSVTVHIRTMLDQWGRCVPLLKYVRGDGFTLAHWTELFTLLKLRNVTQDTVNFGQILDRCQNILGSEVQIKKLHSRAQGEAQIREALDDVRAWGTDARFALTPHPDRAGVVLITDWKDTMSALSDNRALLLSMKESPYFSLFSNDATKWEERLSTLDEYLRHMSQIQRKWVYLEPIFRRGALPNERQRFERIDGAYLSVMKAVQTDSRLMALADHGEFKSTLRDVSEQLERCQKALNEYLESKRDSFPRFYFISDDDLLEILAQSKNPSVIQTHLKKLFMGIHSVQFDAQKDNILQVLSLEGETVTLLKPVRVTEEVEAWLAQLDVEVKATLKAHVAQCVAKSDIGAYASQVLCTAEMVTFTRKVEAAIREPAGGGALKKLKAGLQTRLRELTAYAGGNSDALVGIKLKALIMDLIHNIAVVDLLSANNVEKETHWLWKKQLRYYLDGSQQCLLRMVDAEFRYSYEYQGNAPKLVHTPLTDRCYLTLTQGMQLGYGGNPYGPAGTGKTESVKALGNAMGRQVLVFNCDEGIDFKSMGRIFTGLVKCGAWGCFDEFNRLKVDQLSAVSQMIQVIQEALKNGERSCGLLGRDINVDPNAGIFVTLNPAGKGYGGRSKLPDNLKQLFRSISMSAPDNELITETILYSEGFENATQLATKVVETFKLSSQLLSYQQHYDWGLRAMKAVLRLGGILIHDFLMERVAGKVELSAEQVLQKESEILIKSLRVNTLSKLTFDDALLYSTLLADIFPDVPVLEIDYKELRPAIEESVKELKLQLVEGQVQKILQLYEALRQRMGVVLVGPSGSGKSTLMRVLRRAMQRLGKKVPLYIVNPKALPRDQLLGHMDPDTREWFDGVLTDAARKVVKEEPSVQSWVFCDGDIDPEWVESLNSVLDDNKLLTMPNGVRVQFGDNVNFLFETHSLEFASPATVSRMGIIYLSEEDVDPKVAVASWLAEQPEESQAQLQQWIDSYFYKAIESLLTMGDLVVGTTRTGLVMSGLAQLKNCSTKKQFALALLYGLGSYLPEEKRRDYAKDVLFLVEERAPDPKNPLDFKYDEDRQDYVSLEFEPASDLTVEELYRSPMVATVDCQRALEVMRAWTTPAKPGVYRPFILVGPEGCGKSMLLNNLFAHISNTRVASVNCSAQTEAIHVIQKLKQTCSMFNSNQGKVLRPKEAERLILLLKDLNLPKPDRYGTVQLHSLLQQLILYNGFYDADLEWVTVERVQIVGSMNPPGSMGRHPVAPRFLAITSVLAISYPSKESLQLVYSEFLKVMLQSGRLKLSIANKGAADLARVLTTVYETAAAKCTVDVASHYVFNPRDLTKWVLNLLNYDTPNMGDVLAYEARRIFVDRLVTLEERVRLAKAVRDNVTFLVGHRDAPPEKEAVFYVSWLDAAPAGKKRLVPSSLDEVKKSVDAFALKYARENADLNVQLIPEVCAWITRVDRVLSQERGNLLLVARSGVCAPQIVRLVAYNNRIEVVTLGITRDYSIKHFTTELKAVMTKAGVEGQSVVLLLEDFNFFHPYFLETINSILSSGEVPGLFTQEEQDAMLGPLKDDAMGEGMSTYSYFVERIARYLHVVVVMDPTNPHYEPQCRANPALFTRCNVYWMGTWDSGSLKVVPRIMIADTFAALDKREDKKEFSLTTELVHIHRSFGDKFSPQHFKVLCETFDRLFQLKSKEVTDGLARLRSGVTKLDEAQENVDKIATDVTEKKGLLEVKQREADEALKEIQKKMEEAGNQKRSIHKIQKELDKEQTAIQERKVVIEGRLSGIQPVLDAALSAVSSIRSDHLTELRSMAKPPAAVQCVMQGVVLLIESGRGSAEAAAWPAIRKVLAGDIKGQILNFDIDNVSPAGRAQVDKFIAANSDAFKRETIARASKAAAPMAEWLKAVVEYSKVLETVAPMRAELKEYEAHIQKGQEEMTKYEGKLKKVERKVDELKHKFGEKTTEAERLKDQLEQAEQLLVNAKELLSKLGDEHTRWTAQMKTIKADANFLPKRCLLAAAFVTYLGQDAEDKRRATLAEWRERVKLPDFNFFTFLRDESVQLHYKAEGLPGDELSLDNAVMIHEQVNTAFIEDPSGQAVEWLQANLKKQKAVVDVCNISEDRLVSALELALRFGKKFIITDVDRIEPFLYPILRKELHNEGTKRVIQIGDRRTVDYADGFQLYLVTRSTDMRVAPDILSYLTPISFSITHSGLEGQFLGITIQHEQPQLEKEKLEILRKEESLKMQLAELEERLLANLANSEGSLLENKTLIESLNQIKSQASDISAALDQSKVVQEDLDAKRNVYRPFATTASAIFFLTKSLSELSHMYQFSFHLFLDLFQRALHRHKDLRTDPETKIAALQETFIQITVSVIAQSLFKEHRVVYGVHLCRSLYPAECTAAEWDFFVDEAIAPEEKRSAVRVPTFVLPDSVETFRTFGALFPDLAAKARFQEADVWLQWMRAATPETDYPGFLKPLTHFQRLLLMKTLRGDRLIAAMSAVSCTLLKVDSLGESSTLASAVGQSEAARPVLLLISAGADPSQELQAIAHDKMGRTKFHQLAMGSGQTDEAMRLVRHAAAKGEWVFLKNLHLVIPWVTQLQKELTVLKPHAAFRLFLTSEAHDEFPSILLGQSLKITFEPPPGIKQNLLRTYRDWGANFVNEKDERQRQLLFTAAALQAIVQERRSYVPQGWTKDYEVTAADLKSSSDIVLRQSAQGEVDWRSIRGILNDAIYGGKMETASDTRVMTTYIEKMFSPHCAPDGKQQEPLFHHTRIPNGDYAEFVKVIKKLPDSDIPVLFALPPNADRVVQLTRVRVLTNDLQRINESQSEAAVDREAWAARLTPLLDAWAALTAPHGDVLAPPPSAPPSPSSMSSAPRPIDRFIAAERLTALRLVARVNATMTDLRKVIEGNALLTEDRRREAAAMLLGDVPATWEGSFPSAARIAAWLQSLVRKAVTLSEWEKRAASGTLMSGSLDLSKLLRAKTFLNALRQQTAHVIQQPLVSLTLVSTTSVPPPDAPSAVALEGLLLQGAVLDDADRLEAIATADEPAVFPIKKAFVAWMATPPPLAASVRVPVYANSTKEDYVCDFVLPCADAVAARNFVLSGVSIVLEQ